TSSRMFRSAIATEIEGLPSAVAQMLGVLQNGLEPSARFPPYNILSSGFFIPGPLKQETFALGLAWRKRRPLANGSTSELCAMSRRCAPACSTALPVLLGRGHIDARCWLDRLSPAVDAGTHVGTVK